MIDKPMDATSLAQRAIQEIFSRALGGENDDVALDYRDRVLSKLLTQAAQHFNDPSLFARALNAPMEPYSNSLPLGAAAIRFAGARGKDYQDPPACCLVLLGLGADPFALSPGPALGSFPGHFLFGRSQLSAFEIALARADAGLTLAIIPMLNASRFTPAHWTAYALFCDFPQPFRSQCDEAFGALAERGLLLATVDKSEISGKNKRL